MIYSSYCLLESACIPPVTLVTRFPPNTDTIDEGRFVQKIVNLRSCRPYKWSMCIWMYSWSRYSVVLPQLSLWLCVMWINMPRKLYFDVSKLCKSCPATCKKCTSPTQCVECIPHCFNNDTISDCSLSCPEIGACYVCKQGYYNINKLCRNIYLESCKICGHDLGGKSRNANCLICSMNICN